MALSKFDLILRIIVFGCAGFLVMVIIACLIFLFESISQGYGVAIFSTLSKGFH